MLSKEVAELHELITVLANFADSGWTRSFHLASVCRERLLDKHRS